MVASAASVAALMACAISVVWSTGAAGVVVAEADVAAAGAGAAITGPFEKEKGRGIAGISILMAWPSLFGASVLFAFSTPVDLTGTTTPSGTRTAVAEVCCGMVVAAAAVEIFIVTAGFSISRDASSLFLSVDGTRDFALVSVAADAAMPLSGAVGALGGGVVAAPAVEAWAAWTIPSSGLVADVINFGSDWSGPRSSSAVVLPSSEDDMSGLEYYRPVRCKFPVR